MSFDITNNIVYCDHNNYKRVNYIIDFCNNTNDNNFDTTIANTKIKNDHIYNSCVYNNIDNRWPNPNLQILSTISNIKATTLALEILMIIIISYCNKS